MSLDVSGLPGRSGSEGKSWVQEVRVLVKGAVPRKVHSWFGPARTGVFATEWNPID